MKARVFVPASIGNVGPGFDVLGLAIDGLGDLFTVELVPRPQGSRTIASNRDGAEGSRIVADTLRDAALTERAQGSRVVAVTGRDAALIPLDPAANCTAIAALSALAKLNDDRAVHVTIERRLPVSGGLGGSAAASVGGALAAVLASGKSLPDIDILRSALDGEERVAGRHLDNIAPAFFGGLCLCRAVEPPDAATIPIRGDWWITVVTSTQKLATKDARQVLPDTVPRAAMIALMAHTAGVVAAFAKGDHELLRRSLVDSFAEPRRAPLIDGFARVKAAALAAGALGCSISGAGPTLFALSATETIAKACRDAMLAAFHPLAAEAHVGEVARQGARPA